MVESLTLVQFAQTTDPGAAARREQDLTAALRAESGMAALIGPDGQSVLDALTTIENGYAHDLIADIASAIDAGTIPTDTTSLTTGEFAAIGPFPQIDISLFADTGFTASALMQLYSGIVKLATTTGSGTLPRQESFDETSSGLRQQVDLATTSTVTSGGGHVSADIIMSATDRITDAASGSFVALYTSRTTGHFDVNACPDASGVGEGTYTFDTKHELNDVSSPTAARSAAGRSVTGPFQLVNGPDAHLQRIDAQLDLKADSFGPGSAGGPGPTAPFNWSADQQSNISMPANGGATTATGSGINISGTGAQGAGGSLFLSSAMAQLFLAEVAKEAEKLWRSGECIEIKTNRESGDVAPDEEVQFQATSVSKIDGADVDAPIKGTFSGKDKLDPDGQAQDPPVDFTFTAGSDPDDKGTIALEQVGVRGIGKKTLEFTVKSSDYRIINTSDSGLQGTKCDGLGGTWSLSYTGQIPGTTTFTLSSDGGTGAAHTDLFKDLGHGATTHYVLDGTASIVKPPDDGPYALNWVIGSGTLTVTSPDGTQTVPTSFPAEYYELEQGDFCT